MRYHGNNSDRNPTDSHSKEQVPTHIKKQSQRTSAIALGVLLLISFGLMGSQSFTKGEAASENANSRGSKSLLIVSQERERDGAGLISKGGTDACSQDIEALTETNRLQTSKIKALKQQLVEANQKLHEVKGHLFTKGDPSDRSRLAEICQDLVEKERESHEYREKVEKLEKEKQEAYQKINRMEHTIDALASMTDSQRTSKEQAIATFQQQLDQLQDLAKAERDELQGTIEDLEDAQSELKISLTKKMDIIKNLENEITWQYNLLTEKDNEIKSLSQLYTSVEGTMNKHLQDLVAALELEMLKNHNLGTEIDVSHTRHAAQLQVAKSLEDRIQQADEKAKQIYNHFASSNEALIKEYLDFQGLLDVYAHSHNQLSSKNKKLAALANGERSKAHAHKTTVDDLLAKNDAHQQRNLCLEQELSSTVQQLAAANERAEIEQNFKNQKHEELELLTYAHASLRDQLNERIAQLNANLLEEQNNIRQRDELVRDLAINLELEKTRSQELGYMLKTAIVASNEEQERNSKLEWELSTKTEIMAALEGRIQDKQTEIADLTKQLENLSSNYADEQIRTQELHRALVTALQDNENNLRDMRNLTQTLEGRTDTVALLQDRLSQKSNSIDLLQDNISKLEDDLEESKGLNEELQRSLANILAHRDAELERSDALENEAQTNAKKLVLLQDNLADKHHEIRTLLDQIQALNRDLDAERDRSKTLQNNLEIALAKHENEFRTARGMESSIADSERQIQSLLDQLDLMAGKFSSEQQRARDLEQSLISALSKHDSALDRSQDLEHSLWENNRKITSMQGTLQEQEQVIDRLQQHIAELNEDLKLEENRGFAFKQSSEKEAMQRFELEKMLAQAEHTINDLRSVLSSKENDHEATQNKLLALAAELDMEITRSVQLHSDMEERSFQNDSLIKQAQNLEAQLEDLKDMLREKEDSLLNEEQQKTKLQREHSKLQHELGLLHRDKAELEQKYINQLNLVLKQQELVNQLSNELTAHKQMNRQYERQQKEMAETDRSERPRPASYIPSPSSSSYENTHQVREGEDLSSISIYYYGTPSRWYDIYNANRDLINDAYEVEPGTEIIIPN